jgi:hypothetical protein
MSRRADSREELRDRYRSILDRIATDSRPADHLAGPDAAAGQDRRVGLGEMVAAGVGRLIATRRLSGPPTAPN